MRKRCWHKPLLLALLAVCAAACSGPNADSASDGANLSPVLTVYYFHRTLRCPSCEQIELWTRRAVEGGFSDELASGRVRWSPLNLDEPEFAHFNKEYDLNTQSVVLSLGRGAKEDRWKNLEKVWDLLDNQEKFTAYVEGEMRDMMKDAG